MDTSWYTYNELNFLDWLGTGTFYSKERSINVPEYRLAMLKGYLRGMTHRVDWGKLDPEAIREHVTQLIRSIEKSIPTHKGDE